MKTIDADGNARPLADLIAELSYRFRAATFLAEEVIDAHGCVVGSAQYALANTVRMIQEDVDDMLDAVNAERAAQLATKGK